MVSRHHTVPVCAGVIKMDSWVLIASAIAIFGVLGFSVLFP